MKRLNATPRPISRNLLIQLRVFGIIFLGMLAVLVYDALIGAITVLEVAGGLVLGFAIGVVLSRTYTLSYDEEAQHVAGRIDWVGGVILLLYIGFSIFRGRIFTPLVDASQLAGFLLAVSAGTMLGRLVGTGRGVWRVLRAWGLARVNDTPTEP